MTYSKEEYNKEPVFHCANCLSLNIKNLNNSGLNVCGDCGNTQIEETDIYNWIEIYIKEYGKAFITEEEINTTEEEQIE